MQFDHVDTRVSVGCYSRARGQGEREWVKRQRRGGRKRHGGAAQQERPRRSATSKAAAHRAHQSDARGLRGAGAQDATTRLTTSSAIMPDDMSAACSRFPTSSSTIRSPLSRPCAPPPLMGIPSPQTRCSQILWPMTPYPRMACASTREPSAATPPCAQGRQALEWRQRAASKASLMAAVRKASLMAHGRQVGQDWRRHRLPRQATSGQATRGQATREWDSFGFRVWAGGEWAGDARATRGRHGDSPRVLSTRVNTC